MRLIGKSGFSVIGFAAGLLAALIAAPGHAVEIPVLPLQTGTAYPPANVMFILDDSGSMEWIYMYNPNISKISYKTSSGSNTSSGPTGDNKSKDADYEPFDSGTAGYYDRSYATNGIYYNPNIFYQAWIQADGSRVSGGTTYSSVYTDTKYVGSSSSTTNLSNKSSPATYFVPKSAGLSDSQLGDLTNYYRFQIKSNGEVWRAEYVNSSQSAAQCDGSNATGWRWRNCTHVRPTERTDEEERNNFATWYSYYRTRTKVAKAGASDAFSQVGSGVRVGFDSINSGSVAFPIPVDTPTDSGDLISEDWNSNIDKKKWWTTSVVVPAGASNLLVKIRNGSGGDADLYLKRGAAPTTSNYDLSSAGSSNSESVSKDNPAAGTWYIGIYNASTSRNLTGEDISVRLTSGAAGSANYGLFDGENKKNWYAKLFAANASGGTPLRTALKRAGEYYKNFGSTGPWGPETGVNQYSCRQAFSILTTDGYWNDSSSSVGVGNVDNADGQKIERADGTGSFTYKADVPFKDSVSNTLADVAMKYWRDDLSSGDSGLANNVPSSTADPAFWQHMVTFGVSIGLQGTLDPKTALQSIKNGTAWPDPGSGDNSKTIDDLWHATVNGHGDFVAAANPSEFVQALVDALATVAERLGSASNVTANSTSFQTETRVYQASYVSGKWSGELAAYEVSSAGISSKDLDGDGLPDAAWRASKMIPAFGSRKIYTWGGSAGTAFPTASQLTALDATGRAPVDGGSASGQEVADYIAGSDAKESRNGGHMRDRDSKLGDIANSSPMYVEDSRSIFVGANDGMLHAFAASNRSSGSTVKGGQELFAYIPNGISTSALKSLSDPRYGHSYFVDGPVVVSSQAQTSASKNYLVSTLGRGGAGLFALDVTDPDHFKASDVLWDHTGTGFDEDMGRIIGEPLIVKLNDGTDAVIVGNGISASDSSTVDRHAVLFVINLATGAVIKKFDTLEGGDNGLSAPRGTDTNGDRKVDYVYAGDFKGNVWKFDLSGSTSADWTIGNDGDALFSAADSSGGTQAITAGLAIARDPKTEKIWVFVGTGKFMENGDVTNVDVQSIYGFIDSDATVSRSNLVKRTIITSGLTTDGKAIRGFEENTPIPEGKKGWVVDLDYPKAQGERVVSNPRVQGTVLLVPSMIPPQTGTCDAGGTGFINALDAFTGTSLGAPYFDVNGDGKFDDNDKMETEDGTFVPVGSIDLGVGMPTLPTLIDKLLVVGGSKGTLGSVVMNPQGGAARRISWREILRD